jgi:hypothetical protein
MHLTILQANTRNLHSLNLNGIRPPEEHEDFQKIKVKMKMGSRSVPITP